MMHSLALLLLLGCRSSIIVDATSKDASIVSKAKRKFKSYQSDPLNLLRGIQAGEYERIYIQYHQCAWSEFGDYGDNYEESGCNGGGDGDDEPWYMGKTQCYRTNIAYSLYGVQTGDDSPENACRRRYYINTFFTNNGVENFGNLLGLENHEDATSQCTLADDEEKGENDNNKDDANNDSFKYSAAMYPNAHSYTTFCSSRRFVTAQFRGAYCSGRSEPEILDTLTDLNDELEQLDCALVYSAKGNERKDNDSGDGRKLEEEDNEGDDEEDEEEEEEEENEGQENEKGQEFKNLWNLLSYSSTCSILEHPKACPDPYGVKKHFDLNPRNSNGLLSRMHFIDWLTLILFVLGGFLLALTCLIKDRKPEKKRSTRNPLAFIRRGRSRSPSSCTNRTSEKNINNKDDADTVNTNDNPVKKKKKGAFRSLFSRKK